MCALDLFGGYAGRDRVETEGDHGELNWKLFLFWGGGLLGAEENWTELRDGGGMCVRGKTHWGHGHQCFCCFRGGQGTPDRPGYSRRREK